MNVTLELDTAQPDAVHDAIAPSLRDTDSVQYQVSADEQLHVTIQAETLGQLRGATNTAMMLIKLSGNVLGD